MALGSVLASATQGLAREVQCKVHRHVLHRPRSYYNSNSSGSLVSRIMNDVDAIINLYGMGTMQAIGGLLMAAVSFAVLLSLNPSMLLAVLLIGLVTVPILRLLGLRLVPRYIQRSAAKASVAGRLTETLGGIRVVKAYHGEKREASAFAHGLEMLHDADRRCLKDVARMAVVGTAFGGMVSAMVMYIGAHQIGHHKLTLG